MCQLNLQTTLTGLRAAAENFQNQTGTVDNFDLPLPFQIALLYRCQRMIDNHQLDFFTLDAFGNILNLTRAKQSSRTRLGGLHQKTVDNFQINRPCKSRSFFKPRLITPAIFRAFALILINDQRVTFRQNRHDNKSPCIFYFCCERLSAAFLFGAVIIIIIG